MVYIPDDSDFSSFRDQCESLEGWHCRYNKAGVTVWSQGQEESCTVQKIKVSRRRRLQDRQPFPPPATCPAAPEGPWRAASWGCTTPWSSLHGCVSALNAGDGGVSSPEVLPQLASCSAGSPCPPRGFSFSTCRDARCSVLPCMYARMWAHIAAALDPHTPGKALGSITLWRWPCWEPPSMRQAGGMPPWCVSPGHAIPGHITSCPALDEHPGEFKIPCVLSQEVFWLPGA